MSTHEGKPKWRAWLDNVPPLAYWVTAAILLLVAVTVPAAVWHTWNAATVGAIVAAVFIGLPPFLDAVDKRRTRRTTNSTKVGPNDSPNGPAGAAAESLPPSGSSIDRPQKSTQLEDRPTGQGADGMAWDIRLNPVVAALAQAIPDHRAIRTIMVQAGLAPATIDPEGAPDTRWQVIMEQACDRGDTVVDRVLDLALARSANRGLHDAVAAYRTHRAS